MANILDGLHPSWKTEIAKIKAKEQRIIKCKWALGFKDRGMGHGDFGIILVRSKELVLDCPNRSIAEHLIEVHNASLKRKK